MLNFKLHKDFKSKKRSVSIVIDTAVEANKITAIYGVSGIGKSSILRMIAGLEIPDKGSVEYNGTSWFDSSNKTNLKLSERRIGFVYQEYNLFPNMTVEGNLKYASLNGVIPSHVNQLIDKLDMTELLSAYPSQLSGGQKQRCALLRSLCQNPEVLMLDEPFSSLDDDTIDTIIDQLLYIQEQHPMTILLASHRKGIINRVADEVIHVKGFNDFERGKPSSLLALN